MDDQTLPHPPLLQGKRILVRADLNLPYHDGQFIDFTRVERFLPTIRFLLQKGGEPLILSHLGRPKGRRDAHYSLRPVAQVLERYLQTSVKFVPDCVGEVVELAAKNMRAGDLLLLENVRFYAEEEKNDVAFAKQLAEQADLYINDAFSVSHRAHASIDAITQYLPSYMGLQFQAEVRALNMALEHPKRPCAAIIGGAKVSTKIHLLLNMVKKVDYLMLGGGMANTFLKVLGCPIGASFFESDAQGIVEDIYNAAKIHECQIVLPVDACVSADLTSEYKKEISLNGIDSDDKIFDLGPKTLELFEETLRRCQSVLWNGPVGVFEIDLFSQGTKALADVISRLTLAGSLVSIAGGGDTAAALASCPGARHLTYISTAGGAFLEWLEGKDFSCMRSLKQLI